MAEFTPMGAMVKVPQPMSMGDMVNLARGVQAYQQAEQINPLEIQAKQQATRTGQINLGVAEQQDLERKNLQTFFSDPNNFQTNGRIDLDKINSVVPKIAPQTGSDVIKKYSDLHQSQSQAISAKQKLTQDQRSMIGSRLSILGRAGIQDKNAYLAEMDLLAKENPENKDLASLIDAYKRTWQYIPSGPGLPNLAIAGAQTLLTPAEQESTFGPKITESGGRTTTITPSVAGQPPIATVGIAGGLEPAITPPVAEPQVKMPVGMELRYPVRSANKPYIPDPTELADQEAGIAYRTSLTKGQQDLATSFRNKDEVINQAGKLFENLFIHGGGKLADVERNVRKFFGSAEYDMLAKDLANLALSNSQRMGGVSSTVAGLDMQQVANGTIKVPPEVLTKIAQRVGADMTRYDMEANGARAFSRKYGDNNMQVFQDAWNKSARDGGKIFEAIGLMNSIKDEKVLNQKFTELFPTDAERKQFAKSYRNLKSLAETGVTKSGD